MTSSTSYSCICDHNFTMTAADVCRPARIQNRVFLDYVTLNDMTGLTASKAYTYAHSELYSDIPNNTNVTIIAIVDGEGSTTSRNFIEYTIVAKAASLTTSTAVEDLFDYLSNEGSRV